MYLNTLAAACAEAGFFDQAVISQRQAIRLLSKDDPAAKGYNDHLELYGRKQPLGLAVEKTK